jgi:uncharacterized protein YjbJ (UPF0337 family)
MPTNSSESGAMTSARSHACSPNTDTKISRGLIVIRDQSSYSNPNQPHFPPGAIRMNTSQDNLQARWPEVKGQVKQRWGKLTAEDVRQLNGTMAELVAVLRQRYGYGATQAELEIDQWLADTDQQLDAAA